MKKENKFQEIKASQEWIISALKDMAKNSPNSDNREYAKNELKKLGVEND